MSDFEIGDVVVANASLPCGGHSGDLQHHDDGTPRSTASSANGRVLAQFEEAGPCFHESHRPKRQTKRKPIRFEDVHLGGGKISPEVEEPFITEALTTAQANLKEAL